MPSAQIPCVEMVALMAMADLEQMEGPWLELMQSKDPESVAVAFRLVLAHLTQTSKRLQMADVIQSAEQQGETAYEAVRHQRLQGAAKTEGRLQESERAALTFASNHACNGLQLLAQICEKPVPDSKTPINTGLKNCLLSSRSSVRIRQGAL